METEIVVRLVITNFFQCAWFAARLMALPKLLAMRAPGRPSAV